MSLQKTNTRSTSGLRRLGLLPVALAVALVAPAAFATEVTVTETADAPAETSTVVDAAPATEGATAAETATAEATAKAEETVPAEAPIPDAAELRRIIGREVEAVRDELAYRDGRVRRKIQRTGLSSSQLEAVDYEITRALDRASAEVERIRPARATVLTDLEEAQEWIERAAKDLEEAAADESDPADEALEEAAEELYALAEAVENAYDRIDDAIDSAEPSTSGDNTISVKIDGGGITSTNSNERVNFGGDVHVKEGEVVEEAVAFGGNVYVDGTVTGEAVAFGGNIYVGPTGVIKDDAVTFGGSVHVEEGGVVKGQKSSMGMIPRFGDSFKPELPFAARLGMRIVKMMAWFLVLFVLTLVAFAVAPRRMAVIVDQLETRPIASGGFGLAGSVGVVLLTLLLCVTIIGIILVPPLGIIVAAAVIMGYAALAMMIGRKLPIPVRPSSAAYAALGTAVIVVVANLIPVLGTIAFVVAGFVGLGAVLYTKFGGTGLEDEESPLFDPDDPDAYEAAAEEVGGL